MSTAFELAAAPSSSAQPVIDPQSVIRELRAQLATAHQDLARAHAELATTRAVSAPAAVATPLPPLLRVRDLVALLGVCDRTVRSWRTRGVLPAPLSLPNVVRWDPDSITEWVRSRGKGRK